MQDIATKLAESTRLSVDDAKLFLQALAQLAYSEAWEGFALPGLGEFRVRVGPGREGINPFNGEPMTFCGRPEVQFTLNTAAENAFLYSACDAPLRASDEEVTSSQPVLPEIHLAPDPQDVQRAGLPGHGIREAICKLGGEPDWIQGDEVPHCCRQSMQFYGQLDSLGGDFVLVDMGRLYVFFCHQCYASHSVLQYH